MFAEQTSYTLVAFCGDNHDAALARDFAQISNRFIAEGLNPTCLSTTNIDAITSTIGWVYRIAGSEGLKHHILNWTTNVSSRLRNGDRVIIILIGNGIRDRPDFILNSQCGREYLTRTEVTASLSTVPKNVGLLIINEVCFSKSWISALPDNIGNQPAEKEEKLSRFGSSLLVAAYIEELITYQEGRVLDHECLVQARMQHITPAEDSRDFCRDMSHYILSPNVAKVIVDISLSRNRYESSLNPLTKPRIPWTRRRRDLPRDIQTPTESPNGLDMRRALIDKFLEDLHTPLNCACHRGYALSTLCQSTLRGYTTNTEQTVRTMAWQATQMLRVWDLLTQLVQLGLIKHAIDPKTSKEEDRSFHLDDIMGEKFYWGPGVSSLYWPPSNQEYCQIDDYEAFTYLSHALNCSYRLDRSKFNRKNIEVRVKKILRPRDQEERPSQDWISWCRKSFSKWLFAIVS